MRIVAGQARGRRLLAPKGEDTRPTLSRVKEGVFSAVQFWLPGAGVLDLFAGSGQMGLEAVSRGAKSCTFVENAPAAVRALEENIRSTGLGAACRVYKGDAFLFLARCSERFDLVLMDPPYHQGLVPRLLPAVAAVAAPDALVVCECEPELALPDAVAGLRLEKQYRYGTVKVAKYKNAGG